MRFAAITLVFISFVSFAAETEVERRVRVASEVVQHRMLSQRPIPKYISDAALCVASLKVVKVGFAWGGQGSTGLATCKLNGEWSAPSFYRIGGVTFGLQFGVQFMESVLLFMTPYGREILEHATFEIGADISFAAGPIGGGQGTGVIPDAHVLTYSRSKGLFIGATINGFVLSHNAMLNNRVYGNGISPPEILGTPGSVAPEDVQPFVATMNEYLGY